MNDGIESIERNNTWELVDFLKNNDCIGGKWIYMTKFKANGDVDKYKERLVAKGFSQEYEVDYNETFAPIVRLDTCCPTFSAYPIFPKWSRVKSCFVQSGQ